MNVLGWLSVRFTGFKLVFRCLAMYLFLERKALERRRGQKWSLMNIHIQDQEPSFSLSQVPTHPDFIVLPSICYNHSVYWACLQTAVSVCYSLFSPTGKIFLFVIFWIKHFSSIPPCFGDTWVYSTLAIVTQLPVLCFVGGSVLKKLTVDQNGLLVVIGQNVWVPLEVLRRCSCPVPPKVKALWRGSPSICGWHLSSVNSHKIETKKKQR